MALLNVDIAAYPLWGPKQTKISTFNKVRLWKLKWTTLFSKIFEKTGFNPYHCTVYSIGMKKPVETLTISLAARQAGVGIETIRFYERKGLIKQPLKPCDGGYRNYPNETIQRIRFVRQAQELGFSLREVDELLALRADAGTDCADIRERAKIKQVEVETKIGQLQKMSSALQAVIAACPSRGGLEGCSIIEALENPEPVDSEDTSD